MYKRQGLKLVSDLYRKHRLIEVFLVHHLGYTTEEIHEEAEVLEHTVSDHFVERLDQLLDYPKACPHGGTIPAKGELLVEKHKLTLEKAKEKGDYIPVSYTHLDVYKRQSCYLRCHPIA